MSPSIPYYKNMGRCTQQGLNPDIHQVACPCTRSQGKAFNCPRLFYVLPTIEKSHLIFLCPGVQVLGCYIKPGQLWRACCLFPKTTGYDHMSSHWTSQPQYSHCWVTLLAPHSTPTVLYIWVHGFSPQHTHVLLGVAPKAENKSKILLSERD